jgi:hypothetical protein
VVREVEQAVFVEKLKLRGNVTGSHLPEPVRYDFYSADDEVREVTREHSSSSSSIGASTASMLVETTREIEEPILI